jgi:diadenylate cyclase
MIVELGVDARLLRLQLDEVFTSLDDELDLVLADYPSRAESAVSGADADAPASPKGLRLLNRVPRLSPEEARAIVDHFGELAKILRATAEDIAGVPGVGPATASAVKDTLDRLTESTILDQYI